MRPSQPSRQFEQQQRLTLERLKARIPAGCPLIVERRPSADAWREFSGFRAHAPGCECVGRAQVVTAFIDGYVACWEAAPDAERLRAQALAISEQLRTVQIGPCTLTEGVLQLIEQCREFAAKIQYLVTDLDDRGLLEDHLFTFPDGDTWEARR